MNKIETKQFKKGTNEPEEFEIGEKCDHHWVEVFDPTEPPLHSHYKKCKKCGKENSSFVVLC